MGSISSRGWCKLNTNRKNRNLENRMIIKNPGCEMQPGFFFSTLNPPKGKLLSRFNILDFQFYDVYNSPRFQPWERNNMLQFPTFQANSPSLILGENINIDKRKSNLLNPLNPLNLLNLINL